MVEILQGNLIPRQGALPIFNNRGADYQVITAMSLGDSPQGTSTAAAKYFVLGKAAEGALDDVHLENIFSSLERDLIFVKLGALIWSRQMSKR